jgi:hypothetical protein
MDQDRVQYRCAFQALRGFLAPAVVRQSNGTVSRLTIWLDDDGKAASLVRAQQPQGNERQVFVDTLGTGELAHVELRFLWYAGTSAPFVGGWQVVRLIDALSAGSLSIRIRARGPVSSQAALGAGLMSSKISGVTAEDSLHEWTDVFENGITEYAVQPRANLCGSLAHLESLVKNATWSLRNESH